MDHNIDERTIIIESLQSNLRQIDIYETILYIAGGSISGIFGLTNLSGLLFLLLISLLISLGVLLKSGFNVKEYTNNSIVNVWIQALTSHILTFVLFWTLCYALVYIY
eukprot:gene16972-22468_t